jgi:hypothetical protein
MPSSNARKAGGRSLLDDFALTGSAPEKVRVNGSPRSHIGCTLQSAVRWSRPCYEHLTKSYDDQRKVDHQNRYSGHV